MLNRVLVITLSLSIGVVFLLIGWGIAAERKPTPLEPVSKDEVEFTQAIERQTLDITEAINAEEFILLRDFIINKGERIYLSSRIGQIPIIEYPVDEDYNARFMVYEANRPGIQSDQIVIINFCDTIDCEEYSICYYPNGLDSTNDNFDYVFDPYISNYIDGHVYLVGSFDTGITDEQLMRQITYYYSLLMEK